MREDGLPHPKLEFMHEVRSKQRVEIEAVRAKPNGVRTLDWYVRLVLCHGPDWQWDSYAGRSERQRPQKAIDEHTGQWDAALEDELTGECDAPYNIVVILSGLIAAEIIDPGSHLNELVLINFAAWTRALGEVFETSEQNPVDYKAIVRF